MNFSRDFIELACDKGAPVRGVRHQAGRLSPLFLQCGPVQRRRVLRPPVRFLRAHPARRPCRSATCCSGRPTKRTSRWSPARRCGWPSTPQPAVLLQSQGSQGSRRGGTWCGAPLAGRVAILDDVISAGTSVRESVEIIRAHGATPSAVVIALDRMERGTGSLSAVQEVGQTYGIPVLAVATLGISSLISTTVRPRGQPGRRPALPPKPTACPRTPDPMRRGVLLCALWMVLPAGAQTPPRVPSSAAPTTATRSAATCCRSSATARATVRSVRRARCGVSSRRRWTPNSWPAARPRSARAGRDRQPARRAAPQPVPARTCSQRRRHRDRRDRAIEAVATELKQAEARRADAQEAKASTARRSSTRSARCPGAGGRLRESDSELSGACWSKQSAATSRRSAAAT